MSGTGIILAGAALVALGIGALRMGWRRSEGRITAPLGWASIALGLILLAAGEGAWGLAVGGLLGSAVAFVLLGQALIDSPARTVARDRPTRTTLRLREEGRLHIGRRLTTFMLVIPLAMAGSIAVGIAAQALGRAAGWAEADSNTLGLFVFPIAWALLATVMIMRPNPWAMARPLVGTMAASGLLFWIAI